MIAKQHINLSFTLGLDMTKPAAGSPDQLLERDNIRKTSRRARRSLSAAQQHLAALKLLFRLARQPLAQAGKHCAFYLPNDGEISPLLLMLRIMQRGSHCYLPCIRDDNLLEFRRFVPGQTLTKNAFGIPEPSALNDRISAAALDVVFMPLVAFDREGNRLGMGGGYYDRTFANRNPIKPRPTLVGLAHECQRQEKLSAQTWDVALDYIATDCTLIKTGPCNKTVACLRPS